MWFKWVFHISPNFHTMQSLVTAVAKHEGEDAAGIVDAFGYEYGQEGTALAVMVASIVVLRALQLLGLRFCNNVQR